MTTTKPTESVDLDTTLTDDEYQDVLRPVLSRYGMHRYMNGDAITLDPSDYRAIVDRAICFAQARASQASPAAQAVERTKLHEMRNDDGELGWYFDCDGHYIDVERDADGKYSVFFRNRADKSEAWLDQAAQEVEPAGQRAVGVPHEPVELVGVREEIRKGSGWWSPCSGCYDTEDGHPTGPYSYSSVFRCALGSGCSECGGIGAVWDNTDYKALEKEFEATAGQAAAGPVGYITRDTVAKLQGPDLAADENVRLWHAANPPSRAVVPVYLVAPMVAAAGPVDVPDHIVYGIAAYGNKRAEDDPKSAATFGNIIRDIRALLSAAPDAAIAKDAARWRWWMQFFDSPSMQMPDAVAEATTSEAMCKAIDAALSSHVGAGEQKGDSSNGK